MSFALGILFLFVAGLAFATNKDVFSPAKVFLFSFLAFHIGIFFIEVNLIVWILVFITLTVGLIVVYIEADNGKLVFRATSALPSHGLHVKDGYALLLWTLSIPALASQLYMIYAFGGVEGYINSLALRVVEWRGMGWARTLVALLMPINLAYFSFGLLTKRSNNWWALYWVHFFALLATAVLSGSRSGLLNVFAMQCIIYHYIRSPIKFRNAALFAVALLCLAAVLGVVREGVKVDDGELVTGLNDSERAVNVAAFYYGIEPLEIIAKSEKMPLAFGSTFVSLLTNAVPRNWWPEKPDSGGVFFTKAYTGDAWDGASNLTPTFLGEWIINFGWISGIALFLISYPAMLGGVVNLYRRTIFRLRTEPSYSSAVKLVMYIQVMWAVVALMTGEVTNVLLNLALTQLVPLLFIAYCVKRKTAS